MVTPDDKAFFREMNRDLANSLSDAISNSMKNLDLGGSSPNQSTTSPAGRERRQLVGGIESILKRMMPQFTRAIAIGVAEGMSRGRGPMKEWAEELKKQNAAAAAGGGESDAGKVASRWEDSMKPLLKMMGTFLAGSQALGFAQTAFNQVVAFGDVMGPLATAIGRPDILKNKNLFTRETGEFGTDVALQTQMAQTLVRNNIEDLDSNTIKLLARTEGLGSSYAGMGKMMQGLTRGLGFSKEATEQFGTNVLVAGVEYNILADSIIQAVDSMIEFSKSQTAVFGEDVAEEFLNITVGMSKVLGEKHQPAITSFLQKIGTTGFEQGEIQMRVFADMMKTYGGMDMAAYGARFQDPTKWAAQLMVAMQKALPTLRDTSKGFMLREFLPKFTGMTADMFFAVNRFIEAAREKFPNKTVEEILTTTELGTSEEDRLMKESGARVREASWARTKAMIRFTGQLSSVGTVMEYVQRASRTAADAMANMGKRFSDFVMGAGFFGNVLPSILTLGALGGIRNLPMFKGMFDWTGGKIGGALSKTTRGLGGLTGKGWRGLTQSLGIGGGAGGWQRSRLHFEQYQKVRGADFMKQPIKEQALQYNKFTTQGAKWAKSLGFMTKALPIIGGGLSFMGEMAEGRHFAGAATVATTETLGATIAGSLAAYGAAQLAIPGPGWVTGAVTLAAAGVAAFFGAWGAGAATEKLLGEPMYAPEGIKAAYVEADKGPDNAAVVTAKASATMVHQNEAIIELLGIVAETDTNNSRAVQDALGGVAGDSLVANANLRTAYDYSFTGGWREGSLYGLDALDAGT